MNPPHPLAHKVGVGISHLDVVNDDRGLKLGAVFYCRAGYRSGEPSLSIGADDLITHHQQARFLPAPCLSTVKRVLRRGLDPLPA